MRNPALWISAALLTGCVRGRPLAAPPARITPASERGTFTGTADLFTGTATIKMLFSPDGPRDFGGASVDFEPGARTAWHSHPAGQTLVVTEGLGWLQVEGQPRQELHPGDVVWTPPGARHWHGATSETAMSHIALQGAVDGAVVDWQEHVSDAQYLGAD